MRPLFFVFLIAFLCSGNLAKAQEDSGFLTTQNAIPVKFQGNWASPDCGRNSEALILSKYFYLKAGKSDLSLLPLSAEGKGSDYEILSIAGIKKPLRLEEDSILKVGTYTKGGGRKSDHWDSLPLDSHMEYAGCLDAPKIVPKMMARFMRYIDRVKEQCTASLSNDCARVLFKMTDVSSDKKLAPSEIKRTAATAFLLAALADGQTLTSKQSTAIAEQSAADAQAVSDMMMVMLDKNKSGDLDYNEVVENFTAPQLPVIAKTLASLGNFFPAFKLAAIRLK